MGDDEMDAVPTLPLALYPSRVRTAWLLLVSLLFVAGGVLMVRNGDPIGYFAGGFFALGVPIFALQFHPRAMYLHLTESGFAYCSLFRARTVRWDAVVEFGVIALPATGMSRHRMVAWTFVPGHPFKSRLRGLSQKLSGYEAALPDTYSFKPAELAALMNALRQRYGGDR